MGLAGLVTLDCGMLWLACIVETPDRIDRLGL